MQYFHLFSDCAIFKAISFANVVYLFEGRSNSNVKT